MGIVHAGDTQLNTYIYPTEMKDTQRVGETINFRPWKLYKLIN